MEEYCRLCGAMDAWSIDDHSCAENIEKQIRALLKDAGLNQKQQPDGAEVWDDLERDVLLELETKLTEKYEALRQVTIFYSDRLDEARDKVSSVYTKKQAARQPVNAARMAIRRLMAPVGVEEGEESR